MIIKNNNLISYLIAHKTAPNLLLFLMLILGLFSSKMLNTQFFPNYTIDYINISVEWPGASAKDVESSILEVIEPNVRYIDGIKRVKSYAREGSANISLEFEPNADLKRALSDVEMGVSKSSSMPENSREPEIKRIIPYEQIGLVLVYGSASEDELKKESLELRKILLNKGIDKIDIEGIRSKNIYVDVSPVSLLANRLTLSDISKSILSDTGSVPSGIIRDDESLQLRLLGEKEYSSEIKDMNVVSNKDGMFVKVKDIAKVYEGYDYNDISGRSNKKEAITLRIYRALGNDTLELTKALEETIKERKKFLPSNIEIDIYDLSSQLIRDRINLLLKNGIGGLILVLIILSLFLRGRVVVWVAVGIPAALAVTLAIMLISGQSINMISLFALIMMIGIIVDDSIVVAEHIETQYEMGLSNFDAAYKGAIKMLGPVTAASITTIAAFAPVLLISGIIGQIISAIPFVVISVILASLFECFFVLPGHLSYALKDLKKDNLKLTKFKILFERFKNGTFRRLAISCLKNRYLTLASSIAILIAAIGMITGGHVKFYFFPSPESPIILSNFSFSPGTNKREIVHFIDHLETTLYNSDKEGNIQKVYSTLGKSIWGSRLSSSEKGEHVGGMIVELSNPEKREIRTSEVIKRWKNNIDIPPGLEKLTIVERKGGPPGLDIDVRLRSSDLDPITMKKVALLLSEKLSLYNGVTDISDDLPWGKRELSLSLSEKGKSLGFDSKYVAKEVRAVFDGISVRKFYRGEEEIEVIVRNDPLQTDLNYLSSFIIKSPSGVNVPLSEVVKYEEQQGFSIIKRQNGEREVSVTAEIDENILNPDDLTQELIRGPLKEIEQDYGIEWRLAGRAEEQAETFGDMKKGTLLALGVIYIILAFIFHSYLKPFAVMSIIPFSLVGVIFGHWVTGFDITILSLVSLLGLSGIVVNDSIIMVSTINDKAKKAKNLFEAVLEGTISRLRAVILTSMTTIGGLTPLLFETSVQAQFLKPMAITMVFGLLATTFMVLVLVPALILIGRDIQESM